jgi:transcription factor SPN1
LKGGKKKRKKQDGEDLENSMDDELSTLRERMKLASEEDAIANGERRAAVAKLKMLGDATTMLTK